MELGELSEPQGQYGSSGLVPKISPSKNKGSREPGDEATRQAADNNRSVTKKWTPEIVSPPSPGPNTSKYIIGMLDKQKIAHNLGVE